jgi:hypothetical protein
MDIKAIKSKYEDTVKADKTLSNVQYFKYNQKVKKTKKKYDKEKKLSEKLKKSNNIDQ